MATEAEKKAQSQQWLPLEANPDVMNKVLPGGRR